MKYKTHIINKLNLLEVDNERGLRIIFSPIGASIRDIYFNDKKVTLSPEKTVDFLDQKNILGKPIELTDNSKVFIHNDKEYKKDKRYVVSNYCFQSRPYMDKKVFSIMYIFGKKKMMDGLPNNVNYYISYSFGESDNVLLVDYRVMADIPTPMSLANNLVFNLGNDAKTSINHQESTSFEKSFDINEQSILSIEDDETMIEVTSNYKKASFNKESLNDEEGILIRLSDENISTIKEKELYNRQILYKFIKK